MAAHQLAIAKASFSAALLRPDPTSLSRDDIATFHTLLDNALSHCSRLNVQSCKEWLLQHVVPSSNRVGVLGKYLVALSTSFELSKAAKDLHPATKAADTRPSGKRKRLHILYLLNDILHHTKYHGPDESVALFVNFSSALQPHVVDMVGLTAGYEREKNPKHHRRLNSLLDVWHKHGYYSAEYVEKLQGLVKHAESVDAIKAAVGLTSSADDTQPAGSKRDAPYIMPASHGDSSTPFYDLPAGNIVPHIIPDSTTPIRPETVKPLQFLAGPADQKLVGALTKFFKDVDHIYNSIEQDLPEDAFLDVDELGENIIYDERTGEIIEADTYYGWSREFCQQMKKRRAGETSRRSRSYSSGSEGPHHKRRYSRSDTRGRSRSRSRSRNSDRRRYAASSHSDDSRNPSRLRFGLQSRSRSRSYSPRLDSTPHTHTNTLQNPPPLAPSFPTQPYPYNGAGAAHTTQYPANIPTQSQINLNPWPMPHGQYPAGFPSMIPPGIANLPHPYHAAGQPVQYGGQPAPAPGHQMYSGTFPSPWQAGFQNNGQGQQGSYTNDFNQGGKR